MNAVHEFVRHDVTFVSGDTTCAAWLYLPTGVTAPPVVVLGHGLGATREMRLDAFAERFAQAGIAALAFTYRHFGDSGGQPRNLLSIKRQLADWDASIAYVKAHPDLDGTASRSGAAPSAVATPSPSPHGTPSSVPRWPSARSPTVSLRRRAGTGCLAQAAPGRRPGRRGHAPAQGPGDRRPRGGEGIAGADDRPRCPPRVPGARPRGRRFVNEAAARVIPNISAYRPGRAAKRIAGPILFCVSNTDTVTPPAQTLRYARTAPAGRSRPTTPATSPSTSATPSKRWSRDQVEFLTRHLADAGPWSGAMSLAVRPDHRADVDPDGAPSPTGPDRSRTSELLPRVPSRPVTCGISGVGPGDVVALKLANRIEFVVLLFAAWRVGAAVTPINPSLTEGEVDRQLDDSGARLLVTEDGTTPNAGVTALAVGNLCRASTGRI